MQVYYINLARRTDRRAFMEAQFERLAIAATRIEAVTPGEVSASDRERYCDPRRPRFLMPAELCCTLSHLRAMAALVASGAPLAAIFEDDVVLSPRLPAFLAAADAAPPDLDLLRIETYRKRLRIKPDRASIAGVEVARFVGWEGGSAGYVVTLRGAEALLQSPAIKERFTDQAMFDSEAPLPRRLVVRQANPGLCIQTAALGPEAAARLGTDLDMSSARAPLVGRYRLRHALHRRLVALHRDSVLGLKKAWFLYARGARLTRIPFAE